MNNLDSYRPAAHAILAGIDAEKCARRNRLAALRFGVNTAELSQARAVPKNYGKLDFARGSLPASNIQALERINAMLPPTAAPLTLEDIYILPLMEAANNSFISDRYMFLGSSTLRNIQREAELGFAFMNSHRTGNVSTPSEQPFGKTFAARYERYPHEDPTQRPYERTQILAYMLKGVRPNGDSGPTTDDMYASIVGGTAPDVSMGINGGSPICDVCGWELRSENCGHAPGTMRNVTPEQSLVQKRRGVNKGFASYTLEDGHAQEVSAVYSGAVPGAGFSKAYDYAKHGQLSGLELGQMAASYHTLLAKGEFGMNLDPENFEEVSDSFADKVANRLKSVFSIKDQPRDTPLQPFELGIPATSAGANFVPNNEVTELVRQNNEMRQQLQEREEAEKLQQAKSLVSTFLSDNHLLPAGENAAVALSLVLASLPDEVTYTDSLGAVRQLSPLRLFEKVMEDVPQHGLLADHAFTDLPKDAVLLRGEVGDTDEAMVLEAKADAAAVTGRRNGH